MWGTLFWITATLGSITALLNVLGANFYDIQQAGLRRQKLLQPHARRYRKRPLVTLIMASHNSEVTITSSLNSIIKSNYRKLEIIVVDQASNDATAALVKQFIKDHPAKHIRLCRQKQNYGAQQAWRYAHKKYAHGEVVMLMDRPLTLDKSAITKAVEQFNMRQADILLPNYKIARSYTTAGLFQEFWLLLQNRAHKASNWLNSAYFI